MAYLKLSTNKKIQGRARRHNRVRSHLAGTTEIPRLAVFRSNRFVYAQVIDDSKGTTLLAVTSLKDKKGTPVERAHKVGEEIAKQVLSKKIEKVVFDRGGFLYQGQVKAVAEGARKGGLNF